MKAITWFLLLSFYLNMSYSQDVIILKNNQQVKTEVTEVTDTVVKYKLYARTDSTIYTLNKNEIYVIKYEDGRRENFIDNGYSNDSLRVKVGFFGNIKYYEGDNRVSKSHYKQKMYKNYDSYKLFMKGNRMYNLGNIIGFPAAFLVGYNIGTKLNAGKLSNPTALTISGLIMAGSIVIGYYGEAKMKRANRLFNSKIDKRLNINVNQNAINLVFNF